MEELKSIFLQQSYRDAWDEYARSLKESDAVQWDYIVLTASDENQAKTYRAQIHYRLENGFLPNKTRYAVLPDPDGKRVGSGGATLNVLRFLVQEEQTDRFDHLKILVVHSGGDSKRIPQYSACGKVFSPVPRELPDGRCSTLFDELMISMSGVAARMTAGMLVMSGDVLMLFNALQIDFCTEGAAALTIKESPEVGRNHGVFKSDSSGNVERFLHKKSVDELLAANAIDAGNRIHVDTGAIILDHHILNDLWSLVRTDDAFNVFVNEHVRLSFYADFLFPMATESTFEAYMRETPEGDFSPELLECRHVLWDALHKYKIRLLRLSPAAFIHFGTTQEVLRLLNRDIAMYDCLGWKNKIHTNYTGSQFAARNSYIHPDAEVGVGCYIEDCILHADCRIGRNCVISGLELRGAAVPDNTVLHGLRLRNGKYTVRAYGVADNPKEPQLFGKPISQDLWSYADCPVCDTLDEAVSAALSGDHAVPRISLRDGFSEADGEALLLWQHSIRERVCAEIFLEKIRAREPVSAYLHLFGGSLSEDACVYIQKYAAQTDPCERMRICHALSLLSIPNASTHIKECFFILREAILSVPPVFSFSPDSLYIRTKKAQARLPVRVNWAGSWTDTPPYCIENGGEVLNAAVKLNGVLPVYASVKRIDEPKIILSCLDNGSSGTYMHAEPLGDFSDPFDRFAIQKAALTVFGLTDEAKKTSLQAYLKRIGGGFVFVTAVDRIPRGSGLGTSSILAAACIRALADFFGVSVSDQTVFFAVLCMEQLMSTGGGWQDQAGGLVPGIKLVQSEPGLPQFLTIDRLHLSDAIKRELDERFCLVYTGQRRLARNLLREVVGRYLGSEPAAVDALQATRACVQDMRSALERGDLNTFAAYMDKQWSFAKQLDSGCTNTCIEHIFRVCADLTAGKSICGAGGGGFLQIMLKEGVTKKQLADRLLDVYSDSGVAVWDSSFYWGNDAE